MRQQLVGVCRRRRQLQLGSLRGRLRAALQRLLGDADVAQAAGPGGGGDAPGQRLHRLAAGAVDGGERIRPAATQRGRGVGEERRVGAAVPGARLARERLAGDVVQPVPGGVDGVARQQRGERQRVAVGLRRRPVRRRRRSAGPPRARPWSGRARRASSTAPSTAWPSELAALAARPSSGWEPESSGSLTTIAGRRRGVSAGTPRAWRCTEVISAAESVVGDRGRATARPGGGQGLRGVDDAAAAEAGDQPAVDHVEEVAGDRVDLPAGDVVHGTRPLDQVRRGGGGALGGQEDVVVAEDVGRLGQRAAPEADEALAVAPREGVRHRLPRRSCSRSSASNSALKLPLPKPRAPWRSMTSQNIVGRSPTGFVKVCRR